MALAAAAVSARCSLEGPWGDTLNGACFSNSSSFIFSCLRIHGEWGNRLAGAFMLSHWPSLIGTGERQRCQRRPLEYFFFLFLSFFFFFQDDNAYGEISNRARRIESLSVSFFLIQEKFLIYLRLHCLSMFRVAESKPDFGDNPRNHAGSIIMVVQYIYGVHHIPMYTGLLWMVTDKR